VKYFLFYSAPDDHTLSVCSFTDLQFLYSSAPEVIEEDRRGRSADIFSLGCVFAEMVTVIHGRRVEDFHDFRSEPDPDEPERLTICYYATAHKLKDWFTTDNEKEATAYSLISSMMSSDRRSRPTAEAVASVS
jgi:serine/threonine protein kinase